MSIYMRLTVNGTPKEITTKHHCEPEKWNAHAQRVKGTNEKSKLTNACLDTIVMQVHEARKKLMDAGRTITAAETLKDMLTGKAEKKYMLLEIFAEHNARIKALKGSEYSPATFIKYNTTLEHTRAFIKLLLMSGKSLYTKI